MPATPDLLPLWRRLERLPAGHGLFSHALGFMAPYSGTIAPRVQELAPGRAVVTIRDRRRVRNHLRSVHAAALMNLAELTGSLAILAALPPGARMIVTGFEVEFSKKARGLLTATATSAVPDSPERQEYPVSVSLTDGAGDEVARAEVRVLVGPA